MRNNNTIKMIMVSTLLLISLLLNSAVVTFAEEQLMPFGVSITGYNKDSDYMEMMVACMNDGSIYAIMVGRMYELQRNFKIESEGLNLYKTDIFTSMDIEVVRGKYQYYVDKYYADLWSLQEKERQKAIEEREKQKNNNQNLTPTTYVGNFKLTFYCPCSKCCGKTNGITASGTKATEGRTIAADTSKLPLGTKVYIEGWGYYTVEDKGGGIKGNVLDVFVSSHSKALQLGVKYANVYIVN